MTRPKDQFEAVQALIAEGRNDCEIARVPDIPRETVRDWRSGARDSTLRYLKRSDYECIGGHDFTILPVAAYGYLLGMYLGDGYIARHDRGVWRLRIISDSQYPGIIEECCHAMEALMPGQRAYRLPRRSRCVEIPWTRPCDRQIAIYRKDAVARLDQFIGPKR